MQLKNLLLKAQKQLEASSIDTADLDARLLLQFSLNFSREKLFLYQDDSVSKEQVDSYIKLIQRRESREPVAKIIGSKAFWENDFIVNQHSLDPRPDSEVIISSSLDLFSDKGEAYRFLDLGCGTGCLLFSLLHEFTNATGIATDISADTLKVTQANMELLKLENRAMLLNQNWGDSLSEKFDLIVSNPPYIPKADINDLEPEVKFFDPKLALDGGVDGLDPYRYLSRQIITLLKPGAYAILEFGFGQCESVKEIFINQGYRVEKILIDLSGVERAIIVKANI